MQQSAEVTKRLRLLVRETGAARSTRPLICVVTAALLAMAPARQTAPANQALVPFLAGVRVTPALLARMQRGEPYVAELPGRLDREVVVLGAIRIAAPAERTVAAIRDIERFERGKGFVHTRRLNDPPVLEDFAAFEVDAQDFGALKECRPGRCDVKLGRAAMVALGAINWSAPTAREQVNLLARTTALEYVRAYRRGGSAELAVYADASRPLFVAQEFADMVERVRALPAPLTDLAGYLLEYPARRPGVAADDFFYWSVADFGLKPVFRLNHVVVHRLAPSLPARAAIATQQLYASHYFHTALEIRVLVDAAPDGSAHDLVVLNMARSDGLTGLFGGLVRSKVRSAAREALARSLVATKTLVETAR